MTIRLVANEMKNFSYRVLVLPIVFFLGIVGGRLLSGNASETAVSPRGSNGAEVNANRQLQGNVLRQPTHATFRAALSEPDTYEKILSVSEILSDANPAKFSKWWPLAQKDEAVRTLLLNTWMRRDLSGFATWLTKQPRARILAMLGWIKNSSTSTKRIPETIVRAMANVELDILSESNQKSFLLRLLQIDPSVAMAAGEHASPTAARSVADAIARQAAEERITSDPRGVLADRESEISLDQRESAIRQLGRQDLAEAFRLAESAPAGVERSTLQAALIGIWARSEPAEAIEWTLENLQGRFKNDALLNVTESLRDHDGGQVELLRYANEMPNRGLRQLLIGKVFDGWASRIFRGGEKRQDEVAGFIDAIRAVPLEDLPLNERDIGFMWPNIDLVSSAAAVVEASPEIDIDHFTYYVAQRFNYKQYGPNPVAGIEWAAKLTPSRARAAINTIIDGGQKRIASIADAVAKLPEGELRSEAISRAAERWAERDREAAAVWARSLGDEATAKQILDAGGDPFAE